MHRTSSNRARGSKDCKYPISTLKISYSNKTQVEFAAKFEIPFVSKAGGHSLWSTIGDEGFILDLSRFSHIGIDIERGNQVSVGAGVTIKEANDAAFQKELLLRMFVEFGLF